MPPLDFAASLFFLYSLGLQFIHATTDVAPNSNIFKSSVEPHGSDISFSRNGSVDLFSHNALFLLRPRQELQCPAGYPVQCADLDTCCPGGTQCCEPECCPTDSVCRNDVNGCCPLTAETCGGKFCADAGSVCCGNYVCQPGYECNTQGGGQACCLPNQIKCDQGCCPEGSACSDIPGYCSSIQATTSTLTSSFTRTSTSVVGPTSTPCSLSKRQRPFAADCEYECFEGDQLPVLKFKNVQGQTDELIESMCKGMFERNNGQTTNAEKLTWGGSKDPDYEQRRDDANCDGFCTEVNKYLTYELRQECDEYPPASAKEGGTGANRKCIHWYQNSGTQSHMIRIFASKTRCNLQDGDKFVIRIEDGCEYLGLTKRQPSQPTTSASNVPSSMSLNGYNATLRDPTTFGTNLSNYIAVQLGELEVGSYSITVGLSEQITELYVVDGEGGDYASVSSPSGSASLSFSISNKLSTGASLIAVTQNVINITYTATVTNSTSKKSEAVPHTESLSWTGVFPWLTVPVAFLYVFNEV